MTLIAGLRCNEAVVLASDSQVTVEGMKTSGTKLFATQHGIIWGTAGPIAAAQALEFAFEGLIVEGNPGKDAGRQAVRDAIAAAVEDMKDANGNLPGGRFGGLFAWHADDEGRNYLLKAHSDGTVEFMQEYGSVGSSSELPRFAFFGFNSSGFLEYETLPLEAAKMLAYKVTDDAVLASAGPVDGPIQLAVATGAESLVLEENDLQPVRDTASAFRMHQADFLKRTEEPAEEGISGLLPDEGEAPPATEESGG
jgi:hypothetical protein